MDPGFHNEDIDFIQCYLKTIEVAQLLNNSRWSAHTGIEFLLYRVWLLD